MSVVQLLEKENKNLKEKTKRVLNSTVTLMLTLPCQSPPLLFRQCCWNTEPY